MIKKSSCFTNFDITSNSQFVTFWEKLYEVGVRFIWKLYFETHTDL